MLKPSDDSSKQLFCALRQLWVTATPEEHVRQALIHDLIHLLGYPASHLVVEAQLSQLPHIQKVVSLPKRRIDLLVFAPHIHPTHALFPLLLVECKAVPLNSRTMRQVWGYNYFVQAPFIAAVNSTKIRLEWQDSSSRTLCFSSQLPSYQDLIKTCS
jgi:Type I restriction enzyme R protein N terminus (HSDR_N)